MQSINDNIRLSVVRSKYDHGITARAHVMWNAFHRKHHQTDIYSWIVRSRLAIM